MADSRIEQLTKQGNDLFQKKLAIDQLWQEIADNFYPERADFTTTRNLGADFASNLVTSYPVLCRRDLGNAFSAMLRPVDREWFSIHTGREDKETNADKRWLEWATGVQRRAMYDRATGFVRATKEADNDFAAFGQCVLTGELNRDRNGLLYRSWHLRDVAWCEGEDGRPDEVHRRWKPSAAILDKVFRGKVSQKVKDLLKKNPYATVDVRHVVIPAERYEAPAGKRWNTQYVSIFFEADGGFVNEEVGSHNLIYIIPRWQTVSGSQYAYSPAAVAALPDARLIQSMTLTLLEAGEKAVNPPLIATQDVVRSDMQQFAGGVTWVDSEYDERLGEALRPMTIDTRGIPMGFDMREDVKQMISQAFFLNRISMPPVGGKEMTAYEVGQRVQEYIRNALPLFEPMEMDYNGAICEHTFDLLLRGGAFGNPDDMPRTLSNADIRFRFESPLHQAIEKQKGQTWMEAKAVLADAVALDPSCQNMLDARTALRDVLSGIGTPSKWVRSEQDMADLDEQVRERQQTQELLAIMQQGGAAAKAIGEGAQAIGLSGAA